MACKSICLNLDVAKASHGRYAKGWKRCSICDIYLKWEGLYCPCCGFKLRTMPRREKYKAKVREKNSILIKPQ
jgi:hypothetical protein